MRKLLLASAAILGASGSLAFAQTQVPANPSQGQLAAPYAGGASYNSNNNAWGIPNTPSGSAAAGGLSTYGALGQNFYAVPAPGTVVIRLNGRVETDVGVGFTSLNNVVGTVTTPTTIGSVPVAGTPSASNPGIAITPTTFLPVTPGSSKTVRFKENPVAVSSYMRLYPGFDGASTNGIHYGAQIELRENFQSAQNASGTLQSPSIASPSVNTSTQTVFVRRAYAYLSNDYVGLVRIGQGDGVLGLFDNCIFTSQCWDAGDGVFQGPGFGAAWVQNALGGGAVNYPWLAQAGAEYANNKITYLSPQIYGFDLGLQFAPSQGNAYQMSSPLAGFSQITAVGQPSSIASPALGGDSLIATTTGNTSNRWYNQAGVGGRYEHTFGAVDVKAYGFYEHAAGEDANTYTTFAPGSSGYVGASTNALRYDPISFYQFGLAVTTAGLTAAVTYQGGRVDNQLNLVPQGGAPMSATVFGLTYLNGPWTVGSAIGIIDSQGSASLNGISQRSQFEVAAGGNYRLAPGVNIVLEYNYYQTHQGNFNFATNTSVGPGVAGAGAYNDVHGQALFTSVNLTW
ncbi:MAG TPA: hypothetical protein VFG12_00420 [Rhodopila sp.]|nr:hypothetical protein [Rhodopila sp.]